MYPTIVISKEKTFNKQTSKYISNIPYDARGEVIGVSWERVKQRIKDKFVEYYDVSYDEI